MGFRSLLDKLSSDERVDNAAAEYCRYIENEWDLIWTGKKELGSKLHLIHYVPAQFSVELTPEEWRERKSKEVNRSTSSGNIEFVTGDREEDVFSKLFELGKNRLCVSEGPGAGKTIFSRRLQAYLSTVEAWGRHFDGRPPLVVRWEENSEVSGWFGLRTFRQRWPN